MVYLALIRYLIKSLSARRAWIEIPHTSYDFHASKVALRKESVDRNNTCGLNRAIIIDVALRKESVDRNNPLKAFIVLTKQSLSARRAWIEIREKFKPAYFLTSLSARRAWIEILYKCRVARLAPSLSARRAWIEMYK